MPVARPQPHWRPSCRYRRCGSSHSHREVVNSSQPLFFLMSPDIAQAERHLREVEANVLSEVEDIGSM